MSLRTFIINIEQYSIYFELIYKHFYLVACMFNYRSPYFVEKSELYLILNDNKGNFTQIQHRFR